jgi:hypothetical protein
MMKSIWPGERLGCGLKPSGHSSLIKAGVLYTQWCLKCSHRCWIYGGERFRYLEYTVDCQNVTNY